jgi:uncharacterized damage-inducible protein DinB
MNLFKEGIRSALEEYLEALRKAIDGLTPAEARWQPTWHTNHIAWIVWHMARVEDVWVNSRLRGSSEVWVAGGWAGRFGMDAESVGAGHTMEEVRAMPDIPLTELMAYFDAVRILTRQYLDQATGQDLARTFQHPRGGTITGTWIVGHLLIEEAQHTGQVALIRGMMRPGI